MTYNSNYLSSIIIFTILKRNPLKYHSELYVLNSNQTIEIIYYKTHVITNYSSTLKLHNTMGTHNRWYCFMTSDNLAQIVRFIISTHNNPSALTNTGSFIVQVSKNLHAVAQLIFSKKKGKAS